MPKVNGKEFPYTAKGMAAAKKENKRHEKMESKKEMMIEYGKVKKKPGVKKPAVKKK